MLDVKVCLHVIWTTIWNQLKSTYGIKITYKSDSWLTYTWENEIGFWPSSTSNWPVTKTIKEATEDDEGWASNVSVLCLTVWNGSPYIHKINIYVFKTTDIV